MGSMHIDSCDIFGGLYRLVIISCQVDYPHMNMLQMIMLHRTGPRAWNDFSGNWDWGQGEAMGELSQTPTSAGVPVKLRRRVAALPFLPIVAWEAHFISCWAQRRQEVRVYFLFVSLCFCVFYGRMNALVISRNWIWGLDGICPC